ncbi:DUF1127 domain-containing protein [Roseomonas sp. F4]
MNPRHSQEQGTLFTIVNHDRTALQIEMIRHEAMRARDAAIANGVLRFFSAIGRGLSFLGTTLRSWPTRYRTYEDLRSLTDRELADIGLTRGEISHVFDPDFRLPAKQETGFRMPAPAAANANQAPAQNGLKPAAAA